MWSKRPASVDAGRFDIFDIGNERVAAPAVFRKGRVGRVWSRFERMGRPYVGAGDSELVRLSGVIRHQAALLLMWVASGLPRTIDF